MTGGLIAVAIVVGVVAELVTITADGPRSVRHVAGVVRAVRCGLRRRRQRRAAARAARDQAQRRRAAAATAAQERATLQRHAVRRAERLGSPLIVASQDQRGWREPAVATCSDGTKHAYYPTLSGYAQALRSGRADRPFAHWGHAPRPIDQWSTVELRAWLNDTPEPAGREDGRHPPRRSARTAPVS